MTGKFIPPESSSLHMVDCYFEGGYSDSDSCVAIEGVVGPGSGGIVCGFQMVDGNPQQVLGYDVEFVVLAAWRLPGKPLVRRELTMLRPVPPSIPLEPEK